MGVRTSYFLVIGPNTLFCSWSYILGVNIRFNIFKNIQISVLGAGVQKNRLGAAVCTSRL